MRILLDGRPLQTAGAGSERTRFLVSCVAGLAAHKGVEWVYLLDEGGEELSLPPGEKVMPGGIFWRMAGVAKERKVDLVMMMDGRSVRSGLPQCTWLSETPVLRMGTGAAVQIPLAPGEHIVPLRLEERELVKRRIAAGREYFYVTIAGVPSAAIIELLKAFSLFKKRQLSNMKLVLAGRQDKEVAEKLDTYKYRQDVIWHPGGDEMLVSGAYAMVRLAERGSWGIDVLNAWKAGVPVILMEGGEDGDVLRVAKGDPADMAEALKTLYKDERRRSELIEKGRISVAGAGIDQTVATIWEAIGGN